jgi:hypothetical protein
MMLKKEVLALKSLQQLVQDAVKLYEQLHRHGLFKTAQAMHVVVQSIGYEVAETFDKRDEVS